MATNKAFELDEAMHRRITLAIEFTKPDPILRKQIWIKHIPKNLKLDKDVDFDRLAMNYELTGGLIKNAVMSALSFAVARNGTEPTICQEDMEKAAKLQLRGILQMNEFEKRIIPKRTLNDLIASDELIAQLKEIISFEKARKVLFGQWGFDTLSCPKQGTTVLMYGPSGTGKSLASEIIGMECGAPLKVANLAEVVSKLPFQTTKNLDNLFKGNHN